MDADIAFCAECGMNHSEGLHALTNIKRTTAALAERAKDGADCRYALERLADTVDDYRRLIRGSASLQDCIEADRDVTAALALARKRLEGGAA